MDKPNNLKKIYQNLTYFDDYGGSLFVFFLITIIVILFISYCHVLINVQPIKDDWPNQRCSLGVMPFAGLIMRPEDMSINDYTYANFNYCTQNSMSGIAGQALQPLTYITSSMYNTVQAAGDEIQAVRGMFDKVRTYLQEISSEIMGRIMNLMPPLQEIIISAKNVLAKVQGANTAGIFTLLGSYYVLKSLMGAIAQFILTILIALAVLIAIFWILPFTWVAAGTATTLFVSIIIPLALILTFMTDVLKVKLNVDLPTVPTPHIKCFDKNTMIPLNDGTKKRIIDINVGDLLANNNAVTAKIVVERRGSIMYTLGKEQIVVSDSHIVQNGPGSWLPVSKHPDANFLKTYEEEYLYCLNSEKKTIQIGDYTFTDWDEIYGESLEEIKNNGPHKIRDLGDIHKYYDGGFSFKTQIALNDGSCKNICDVKVEDVLLYGEKVYGIVEIDGRTVNKQYKINLGENISVEGGQNINSCDKFDSNVLDGSVNRKPLAIKHEKLYHLLTNTKTFYIGNRRFYDYNAGIDLFLEKTRGKLLSMKYV